MLTSPPQSERVCFKATETGGVTSVRLLFILILALILSAQGAAQQPPSVTVDGTDVRGTNATVTGTVNPNGLSTAFYLQWVTTAYGKRGPVIPLGAQSTPVAVTAEITGLSPSTTYHYQLVATNGAGNGFSTELTFTTTAGANPQSPTVTIDAATQITSTNATITGTVNPNGLSTAFYVQWRTNTAYRSRGPVIQPGAQNTPVAVTADITGLSPSTTYHYQLVATNTAGNGYSGDLTFTTLAATPEPPQPPRVSTGAATDVNGTSARIYGNVDPNGLPTSFYFQWGTTTAYGNATPYVQLAQTLPVNDIVRSLTGLTPGTTYHYRFAATNSAGSAFGEDMTFTTLSTVAIGEHVFTYAVDNGGITITAYNGPGGAVIIPSTIAGLPVTAIGYNVFLNVTSLTAVTLPETLKSIGEWAFLNCTALTSVTLPNSLVNLGSGAFAGCTNLESATLSTKLVSLAGAFSGCSKLTSIAIPNSVTNIEWAFVNCTSLMNVTIGTGVLTIGENAFGSCSNLTSVTIPASTVGIDLSAFSGSTRLAEINVDRLNSAYSSVDGVLFDKSQATLVLYPEGKIVANYIVPSGVTAVAPRAFLGRANLTGITLPETLTSLGEWAFAWCTSLTRLTLPDSLTSIEDGVGTKGGPLGVYHSCTSLTNVIIGKGLTYLGVGTFSYCTNLVAVYFQGNAPTTLGSDILISSYVFHGSPLVIVYYLPGTTGWAPTFSGRPTALWNPQAQTSDGSFGVWQNGFGFNITGTANIPIVVEACTNLAESAWLPLQSCTSTNGLFYFSDAQWTNYPSRFYRIRSP